MSDFSLYSYWRSSCSYRVRIALHLKKIPFKYIPVHLIKDGGEQNNQDYTKLNPKQEVPTLIHKGKTLGQSMAIIEYLDEIHQQPLLFPQESYKRGLVRQSCEIINSGIQPLQNLRLMKELKSRYELNTEDLNDWTSFWIEKGLRAFENFIADRAQDFSFGSTPNATDCFLIPQLYNAHRYNVDLSKFECICRIEKNCLSHPAFVSASPENQPDCPPDSAS